MSLLQRDETPAEVLALQVPASDWQIIVKARPNLLIEGPQATTERLIAVLASLFPEPLRDWRQPADRAKDTAVLVRDVDRLTAEEQRQLLDHLNGARGQLVPRQVISTSVTAVFPLVEGGLFLADLYYRLNSVRLQIDKTP